MLSAGSQRAGKACLRTQLRIVIAGLGGHQAPQPWQRCQPFSTTRFLGEEEDTIHAVPRSSGPRQDRNLVFRHIHPNGRIIGKPGRRQRQSSEQLATASLGKPSEVIVFHDVEQQLGRTKRSPARLAGADGEQEAGASEEAALSARAIQDLVAGEQHPPEQEEVNASIESLRPDGLVLERQEYERLRKQLVDSYNVEQLARYVVQSMTTAASVPRAGQEGSDASRKIRQTAWRPGQTPLEQRLGRASLSKGQLSSNKTGLASPLSSSKTGLASQILRLSWNAVVQSEEQLIGELELHVRRWQITLLFDVIHEGKQNIDSFVNSPLLLRASDIRPYRQDNVIRITARKRDAEEIVRLLEEKLRPARRNELDLAVFKPLLGKRSGPDSFEKLFRSVDLKYVSELTNTVLEIEPDGKLAMYSITGKAQTAQRLLLSLLVLPSPRDRHTFSLAQAILRSERLPLEEGAEPTGDVKLAPYPLLDAHRCLQHRDLRRLMAPVGKSDGKHLRADTTSAKKGAGGDPFVSGLAEPPGGTKERFLTNLIAGKLGEVQKKGKDDDTGEERSLWSTEQKNPSWIARIGLLLQPSRGKTLKQKPRTVVFLGQIPGLHALLPLFEPAKRDDERRVKPTTQLVAHLRPSPFSLPHIKSLKFLPDVALCFDHTFTQKGRTAVQHLKLQSVSAASKEQELNIALPRHTVDLSFLSSKAISLSKEGWNDPELHDFVRVLRDSVQHGTGALDAKPETKIKLPASIAKSAFPNTESFEEEKEDVAVNYLLDYFEQVQVIDYVPLRDEKRVSRMTPEARAMVEEWPESMVLRCREVDAGNFGGRRTEVSLVPSRESMSAQSAGDADAVKDDAAAGLGGLHSDSTETVKRDQPAKMVGKKTTESTHQVARIALTLARVITSANAGTLGSPYTDSLPRLQRYPPTQTGKAEWRSGDF